MLPSAWGTRFFVTDDPPELVGGGGAARRGRLALLAHASGDRWVSIERGHAQRAPVSARSERTSPLARESGRVDGLLRRYRGGRAADVLLDVRLTPVFAGGSRSRRSPSRRYGAANAASTNGRARRSFGSMGEIDLRPVVGEQSPRQGRRRVRVRLWLPGARYYDLRSARGRSGGCLSRAECR